jgi:hypothetical protein
MIIVSMILSSHIFISFGFYPSCITQPGIYSIFLNSVYLILWTGILPNGFTLVFSLVILRNAMKTKRCVLPLMTAVIKQQRRIQKTESQLLVVSELMIISMTKSISIFNSDDV